MSIERFIKEKDAATRAAERAEQKYQNALERLGEGAAVKIKGVPYEVAYWRGKYRLKCLVSKANRERLLKTVASRKKRA